MEAGFAKVDITPQDLPIRTYLGETDTVLDPLFARAAVFAQDNTVVAFVSLDVVIVERAVVEQIRQRAAERSPTLAQAAIMVSATHNHACPAVIDRPSFKREPDYIAFMIDQAAQALQDAAGSLQEARIGTASRVLDDVSFNRRFVTRAGAVRSQPRIQGLDDDILYREGPIDPEFGVIGVQDIHGQWLGAIANFGCHACHHMGQLSAGYPGVIANRLDTESWDSLVTVFINGPCANVIHRNYLDRCQMDTKEHIGEVLADTAETLIGQMYCEPISTVSAASTILHLPYRDVDEAAKEFEKQAVRENVFQSLIEKGWYDYDALRTQLAEKDGETVEIQVIRLGDNVIAAIPAEYFCEFGLLIKERSPFRRTFVASVSNGWVGYVPTQAAFQRPGGHETTMALWSKMAKDAGDRMADAANDLIHQLSHEP